jgi:hypothetical protein
MDIKAKAKSCCSREKARLSEHLDACDTRSGGTGSRRRCYRIAAKESGRRARKCIIGG